MGQRSSAKVQRRWCRCEEPVSMCHSTPHQTLQNAKHGVCACAMNAWFASTTGSVEIVALAICSQAIV